MAAVKLCLNWRDFETNMRLNFGRLRQDGNFCDATLVCEEGQVEAGLKSIQKKGGGGGHQHPQDTSEKESEDTSGKDKSGDISHQGQVVLMVWAGDDGGEVENQEVAADPPGSSE